MKNFVQQGDVLNLAAPSGGVTSGGFVAIGQLTGVAGSTVAEGELFALSVEGVFEIPKAAPLALSVGAAVYSTAGAAVNTTNTGVYVGIVVEAAASAATTVKVRLSN